MKSILITALLTCFLAFSANAAKSTMHTSTELLAELDPVTSHICHMANVYQIKRTGSVENRTVDRIMIWNNFTNSALLCDDYPRYEMCLEKSYTVIGFSIETGKKCFNGREQY